MTHVRFASILGAFALATAGCGGSATRTAAVPLAASSPSPAPSSSAFTLTLVVPSSGTAAKAVASVRTRRASSRRSASAPVRAPSAARRQPTYISDASNSIVVTIDQPELEQPDARHRVVKQNLNPGLNVVDIDSPIGTLTFKASLYDGRDGKGHELSYAAPQTVTIEDDGDDNEDGGASAAPQEIDVTFDPIIVQAAVGVVSGSLKLLVLSDTKNEGGDETICYGLAGQFTIGGLDGAGLFVYGAGTFLDVDHNAVTVSPGPAGTILGTQTSPTIVPGGVAVSGGSFSSVGGGSFSQTAISPNIAGVAVGATASSSLVKPANALGGPIAEALFVSFETPSCVYDSGG